MSSFLNHVLDQLHITTPSTRFKALTALCTQVNDYNAHHHPRGRCNGWSRAIASKLLPETQDGKFTIGLIKIPLDFHLLSAAIHLQIPTFYDHIIDAAISGDEGAHAALRSQRNYFGTPLYAAVRSGQYDLVRRLICDAGIDQAVDKSNCLEGAVQTNDLDMIRLLLELGAPAADPNIQDAIVCSVELGHTAAARLLLNHAVAVRGDIPWALHEGLFQAGLRNHEELVTLLLDLGALFHSSTMTTIYHYFKQKGENMIVRPGPVELASWSGNEERLRMLLARGADPRGGICLAIAGDNVCTLCLLLSQPTPKPRSTSTWIQMMESAIREDSNEVLRFLLEDEQVIPDLTKAIKRKPVRWRNLMHAACEMSNVEAFDLLVRAGMPVDEVPGQDGWTLMLRAQASSWPGAEDMIRRLQEFGMEPVDVMQTVAREDFLRGHLPDRNGFRGTHMPWRNETRFYGRYSENVLRPAAMTTTTTTTTTMVRHQLLGGCSWDQTLNTSNASGDCKRGTISTENMRRAEPKETITTVNVVTSTAYSTTTVTASASANSKRDETSQPRWAGFEALRRWIGLGTRHKVAPGTRPLPERRPRQRPWLAGLLTRSPRRAPRLPRAP